MTHTPSSTFSSSAFVAAAIPAYVFPTIMSFIPGYLMQDTALMAASYTTIGLSSLLATLGSFIVLWQLDLRQIFVHCRVQKAVVVLSVMTGLSVLVAVLFCPVSAYFNIILSAFIGTTIVTFRQLKTKKKHDKN